MHRQRTGTVNATATVITTRYPILHEGDEPPRRNAGRSAASGACRRDAVYDPRENVIRVGDPAESLHVLVARVTQGHADFELDLSGYEILCAFGAWKILQVIHAGSGAPCRYGR